MTYNNEHEAFAELLCRHLRTMERRLRQFKGDEWDWTPHTAALTARVLAAHAW